MKQGLLPLIPSGATDIDGFYSVVKDGKTVTWFQGAYPMREHAADDHAAQRAVISFLHIRGGVPQAQLANALGIHENTVRAAVRLRRERGESGFYAPTAVRGAAVMTPDVMERCRALLAEGKSRAEVAEAVGVGKANIDKAVQKGRLPASSSRPRAKAPEVSTASRRAEADADACSGMGMACTRVEERALAACGLLSGAETRFEACDDVQHCGILCALPALAANGLFAHAAPLDRERPTSYYYQLTHMLTLLAFMAMLRVKTVESLRRGIPGEFGKLLGLDRVPEVRCVRERLARAASSPAAVSEWADSLCKSWMDADPEAAGTLYVDGHVRVYHGGKTELPRRYVASHRLCLRGVTDYWVNDCRGKPFFYVDRPVDDGLTGVLRSEIVPRLLRDVPGQPSESELGRDGRLPRFRLVFDRAGCSWKFFAEMWRDHRVACTTYLKNPDGEWPESEFKTRTVKLASGVAVEMELAERPILFGPAPQGLPCRELRRLRRGKRGTHQTAIVTSDFTRSMEDGAAAMFARWSQENYFRYALMEYGIDLLADYSTEVFPCRVPVVNPAWRAFDGECRSLRGKISAELARLAALVLDAEDMDKARMDAWMEAKTLIAEGVAALRAKLDAAREGRRGVPKHVPFDDLPPDAKFERLAPTRKLLLDTIRMVAYRAETAMAALAAPALSNPEEARAMVKALLLTSADLRPDKARKELRVVLHPLAEPRMCRMAQAVMACLNDAECVYPGTDLRLVYQMTPTGGSAPASEKIATTPFSTDQEV